ncbi:hypothetical protein E2C01_055184 [Portunus trituberculatus]|uniref:Uncharacterized protein n=1 Tax=Portunus trituberculatus TaxID=210409 RepID=A0A5B7GLX0_PORTR|nr:hypothetical protein [Portunus trituberculatus]
MERGKYTSWSMVTLLSRKPLALSLSHFPVAKRGRLWGGSQDTEAVPDLLKGGVVRQRPHLSVVVSTAVPVCSTAGGVVEDTRYLGRVAEETPPFRTSEEDRGLNVLVRGLGMILGSAAVGLFRAVIRGRVRPPTLARRDGVLHFHVCLHRGTLPPPALGDRPDKVNTATLAQTAQRSVGRASINKNSRKSRSKVSRHFGFRGVYESSVNKRVRKPASSWRHLSARRRWHQINRQ